MFNQLHELLKGFRGLGDAIGMEKVMEFISLTASLKDLQLDAILTAQPETFTQQGYIYIPPEMLEHVRPFVGLATAVKTNCPCLDTWRWPSESDYEQPRCRIQIHKQKVDDQAA
jgi:hypothetical protein